MTRDEATRIATAADSYADLCSMCDTGYMPTLWTDVGPARRRRAAVALREALTADYYSVYPPAPVDVGA